MTPVDRARWIEILDKNNVDMSRDAALELLDDCAALDIACAGYHGDMLNLHDRATFLEERVEALFDAIKHGDQMHQEWLKNKITEHFLRG